MIRCKNVSKTFGSGEGKVTALADVSLEVQEKELLMLVGPSGSGKTTLISIIAGILHPTEGEVHLLGTDFFSLSEQQQVAFRGKEIGFVFQAYNLVPMLTCVENVSVPLILNKVPPLEAKERAEEILIQVGLKEKLKAFPKELSGGQQQRVAIARGCVHKPRLIVCDEPTSALDHKTGETILSLLIQLKEQEGHTVIVVTHDARIFSYADRIVEISDGKINSALL